MQRSLIAFSAVALLVLGGALYLRHGSPTVRVVETGPDVPPSVTPHTGPAAAPTLADRSAPVSVQNQASFAAAWIRFYDEDSMRLAPVTLEQAKAIEALGLATNAEVMAAFAAAAVLHLDAPNSCTVEVELPPATVQRLRETFTQNFGEIVGPEWLARPASAGVVKVMERLLNDFGADALVFAFNGDGPTFARSRLIGYSRKYVQDGLFTAGKTTPSRFREAYGALADLVLKESTPRS